MIVMFCLKRVTLFIHVVGWYSAVWKAKSKQLLISFNSTESLFGCRFNIVDALQSQWLRLDYRHVVVGTQSQMVVNCNGFEHKFVRNFDVCYAFVDGQWLLEDLLKIPDVSISIVFESEEVFEVSDDLGAKYDHL